MKFKTKPLSFQGIVTENTLLKQAFLIGQAEAIMSLIIYVLDDVSEETNDSKAIKILREKIEDFFIQVNNPDTIKIPHEERNQ